MKPGTNLRNLFRSLGFFYGHHCRCKRIQERMDNEGPEWSLANIQWILNQIKREASHRGWKIFSALTEVVVRQLITKACSDETSVEDVKEDVEELVSENTSIENVSQGDQDIPNMESEAPEQEQSSEQGANLEETSQETETEQEAPETQDEESDPQESPQTDEQQTLFPDSVGEASEESPSDPAETAS